MFGQMETKVHNEERMRVALENISHNNASLKIYEAFITTNILIRVINQL